MSTKAYKVHTTTGKQIDAVCMNNETLEEFAESALKMEWTNDKIAKVTYCEGEEYHTEYYLPW